MLRLVWGQQLARFGGAQVLLTQFIFLATGVFTTLGNQAMYYQGAAGTFQAAQNSPWYFSFFFLH
jgi:hypothetical protein